MNILVSKFQQFVNDYNFYRTVMDRHILMPILSYFTDAIGIFIQIGIIYKTDCNFHSVLPMVVASGMGRSRSDMFNY